MEELPYFTKLKPTIRVHKNCPKSSSGTLTLLRLDLEYLLESLAVVGPSSIVGDPWASCRHDSANRAIGPRVAMPRRSTPTACGSSAQPPDCGGPASPGRLLDGLESFPGWSAPVVQGNPVTLVPASHMGKTSPTSCYWRRLWKPGNPWSWIW